MIEQLLATCRLPTTHKELMAYTDMKYKALAYHIKNLMRDNLLAKDSDGKYITTELGLRFLSETVAQLEEPQIVTDIPAEFQRMPVGEGSINLTEVEAVTKDEATEWLQKNISTVSKVIIYSAIALEDLSQLEKLY